MSGKTLTIDAATLGNLRSQYDVIPIVRELSADTLTPVAAFAALSSLSEEAFLFESVEQGVSVGRYSFIGIAPRRTLTFDSSTTNPIEVLRSELIPLRVHDESSLPPFFGGAVAYFTYAVAGWSEQLPDRHPDDNSPVAKLLFFDHVVAFDHVMQRLMLVSNIFASDARSDADLLAAAHARLDEITASLRGAQIDLLRLDEEADTNFEASCSREEFVSIVARAKEEIAAGEVFQIVLSQSWSTPYPSAQALTLYRALRRVNPSPYMFLLRTAECTLVGASPEMLVRVQDQRAETRPIAGTRPRGKTASEDTRLAEELLADPKENAEHLMLVDLGRNDVGRVCRAGSVEVTEFRQVERYSHVMHLVSHVTGVLRGEMTPVDLFLSCFPAGTVSGAPKIRAMELIDELEFSRRGAYAGAVAYIGFSGNLDSCISIRTIVLKDGKAIVQAGAGIVHDSNPETEFEETLSKSAALKKAIRIARGATARDDHPGSNGALGSSDAVLAAR